VLGTGEGQNAESRMRKAARSGRAFQAGAAEFKIDSALAALAEESRDVTEEYQWYLGEDAER